MVKIKAESGKLLITGPNSRFPKLTQIAALRILMAERLGRPAGKASLPAGQIKRVPVLGRCPSVQS